MNDKDTVDMMNRCKGEIISLRTLVSQLKPKADAYDKLSIVLELLPKQSISYGEDIIWKLEKQIKEIESNKLESNLGKVE